MDGETIFPQTNENAEMLSLIGVVIANRYRITNLIGVGGMSVVYRATHLMLEKNVAVKMLKHHYASDQARLKRFEQEARAVSTLSHPNIIDILDFGVSPRGVPYMVMDYVQGMSLSQIIEDKELPGVKRALHIFQQACDALQHAHQKGILHRDFKPSNVMLLTTGDHPDFVKLVDFGIAKLLPWADQHAQKLTQTGEVFGSPLYMSPEQCQGKPLDGRSDIYAMGCVMYEVLTGTPPLIGENMLDTMQKQISDPPPAFEATRPDLYIPDSLARTVMRALEKDPGRRQQSMAELRDELAYAAVNPAGTRDGAAKTGSRAPARIRRPGNLPGRAPYAVALLAVALLAVLSVRLWLSRSPDATAAKWEECTRIGRDALEAGDYAEAESQFKSALAQARQLGESDRRYALSLKNLRDAYHAEGKFKEAGTVGASLARITKKQIMSRIGDTGSSLSRLVDLSLSVVPRRFDQRKSAEYREMADTLSSLANICMEQGKTDKAEQLYKAALAIDEKVAGPQSWQVALRLNDLAFFYVKQDDYRAAEPLLRRALPIMQRSLGAGNGTPAAPSRAGADESHPAVSAWLGQYTQLLRTIQRDAQANEFEGRLQAMTARQ